MNNKPKHNASVFGKIAQTYTKQYFDDEADFPYIDKFLKTIKPEGRILDVACGPGMLTRYMSKNGFKAEGIDLAPEMIAVAQSKVPNANFKVMDMRTLGYPDEYFDGLLIAYGLIYIPSTGLPATLKEFHRVLKPGGSMFLINQEGEPDHTETEPMKPDETIYVNFFTPKSLAEYLTQQNFIVTEQSTVAVDNPAVLSKNIIYTFAKRD